MIGLLDRQHTVTLITEATRSGARLAPACAVMGVSLRTVQRWTQSGDARADARPTANHPTPAHALTQTERAAVLAVCHRPEFANLPPSQIVPRLADRGEYLASESSFYRILNEADQQHHRGRARAPQRTRAPTTHCAHKPCALWSWDITWLAGPVRGQFFYLYLILDLFSRKIVGWEVYARESGEHAAQVVRRAVWAERCLGEPLVLHADNGSPMKSATLRVTLEQLGIEPSYSRPRVSNDNPYSESVFRTCKYRPEYPTNGFVTIEAARAWVHGFVSWYNTEHRHSGIRFVTPNERHAGLDPVILANRTAVYENAKTRHPNRWSRAIRNWQPIGTVWLNPTTEPDALLSAAA